MRFQKKYASDYRMEYAADAKGRIRAEAVYIGEQRTFVLAHIPRVRASDRMLLLAAACWIVYFTALTPSSGIGHTAWAVLPHAACAFPLLALSGAALTFRFAKLPLTRQQVDALAKRLSGGSVALLFFSAAALVAGAVSRISAASLTAGDGAFLAADLLMVVAGAIFWSKRGDAATRAVPQADAPREQKDGRFLG